MRHADTAEDRRNVIQRPGSVVLLLWLGICRDRATEQIRHRLMSSHRRNTQTGQVKWTAQVTNQRVEAVKWRPDAGPQIQFDMGMVPGLGSVACQSQSRTKKLPF